MTTSSVLSVAIDLSLLGAAVVASTAHYENDCSVSYQ